MMQTPEVERLPPVTVEFLRIVRGIEAVRLECEGCRTVRVASWADLGLPDDSPFPPAGKVWNCGRCGGTNIAATPESPTEPRREIAAPPVDPGPAIDDFGAISPELRERLETVAARIGRAEE